ncbi:Hypothetical_protein [Hexamita inflata]|uniref:Hypothetical_protein n=1 Tax=Hexamita inflata TaxID=28002 RepID=A0AA86PZI1_9EUKA|nr:Hypothetical protein HINF_LOCUS34632 [Hexamita inflata]
MISYDTFEEALVFWVESGLHIEIRPFRRTKQLYAPLRAALIQTFRPLRIVCRKVMRHSEFRLRCRIYKVGIPRTKTNWQRNVNAATWNTMHKHIQIMLESNRFWHTRCQRQISVTRWRMTTNAATIWFLTRQAGVAYRTMHLIWNEHNNKHENIREPFCTFVSQLTMQLYQHRKDVKKGDSSPSRPQLKLQIRKTDSARHEPAQVFGICILVQRPFSRFEDATHFEARAESCGLLCFSQLRVADSCLQLDLLLYIRASVQLNTRLASRFRNDFL